MSILLLLASGAAGGGVSGTGDTAQAQTTAGTGTVGATATGTTAQAQAAAGTGAVGIAGVADTAQVQTASGTIVISTIGLGGTEQAQGVDATGIVSTAGIGDTAQVQSATGVLYSGFVDYGTTAQAQTVDGVGNVSGVPVTTYYVDWEGGNDANAGTSFATRKKTIAAVTAAMLAPGDVVRVMASPDPTLLGNATWTQDSRTVTLAAAKVADLHQCDSNWTAAADITTAVATDVGVKEGTGTLKVTPASGFTTGKMCHVDLTQPAVVAASASSSVFAAASGAIDGNNSTLWATTVNTTQLTNKDIWFAIHLTQAAALTGYTLRTRGDGFLHQTPTAWDVEGSNDLSSWSVVEAGVTTPATWTLGEERAFTIASPAAYKYFRLRFSDIQGPTKNDAITIAELKSFTFTPLAAKDLSTYQQLSFWFRSNVALPASTLSIRLCSDTAGAVTVDTLALPAITTQDRWIPLVLNKAAALGASIQSIALYADADPGTTVFWFDNFMACKAQGDADCLTLASLIGKPAAALNWAASTGYVVGDERKPTTPNRNGFRYRCTVAGTSGGAEPTWPKGWGKTVTDGGVTWECVGTEETFYPLQSILGATVVLGGPQHTSPTSTFYKYQGDTATVPTYVRRCINFPTWVQHNFQGRTEVAAQDSGTPDAPITFSGGWNRTDMSTQTGESWFDGQNSNGYGFDTANKNALIIEHMGVTRCAIGFLTSTNNVRWFKHVLKGCHAVGNESNFYCGGIGTLVARGVACVNHGGTGFRWESALADWEAVRAEGGSNEIFPYYTIYYGGRQVRGRYMEVRGNYYGFIRGESLYNDAVFTRCRTARNTVAIENGTSNYPGTTYIDCEHGEASPVSGTNGGQYNDGLRFHNYNGVAGDHRIYGDNFLTRSATDQRHTASGLAWKFQPLNAVRDRHWPGRLELAKLVCTAGVAVSVTIWCRRDSTDIKGRLFVEPGFLEGVDDEVSVACEPTINTWVESSTLTFTPTEDGVIPIYFEVWDGVGTTNTFWVDDLTVA